MKMIDCIKNVPTFTDLKRIAAEYVIDYRRLSFEELETAMLKTAPQYYNEVNIRKTVDFFRLNQNRDMRILFDIIIRQILLNADDFTEEQKSVNDKVIAYEQYIVDLANEDDSGKTVGSLDFFHYVLEAAWEHNDDVSTDEQNLINKIKKKLNITDKEYCILEAKIGKYPTPGNILHTKDTIADIRRLMQQKGILLPIRDSNNTNYDIIPEEIAQILCNIYHCDIKQYSFEQLLDNKFIKNKKYFSDMLSKANIHYPQNPTLTQLKDIILERMTAHEIIGGFSPNDGLDKSTLQNWCTTLNISTSGTKPELINRIITYYNGIKKIKKNTSDEREQYYHYFTALAQRDLKTLRQQGVIDKDLECEHKFELATNYIFEAIFKNKPLIMSGSEHPDGMLSFNDKLIMWDNKSKESPVCLSEHIKQFDRYIKNSQKPVSVFIVIGPSFTDDSVKECAKYSLNNDTLILLITAEELKKLAEEFNSKHNSDDEALPLGVFRQNGRFNPELICL